MVNYIKGLGNEGSTPKGEKEKTMNKKPNPSAYVFKPNCEQCKYRDHLTPNQFLKTYGSIKSCKTCVSYMREK